MILPFKLGSVVEYDCVTAEGNSQSMEGVPPLLRGLQPVTWRGSLLYSASTYIYHPNRGLDDTEYRILVQNTEY